MRGKFVRADGLVLPNNISRVGSQMILEAAFRNTVPTLFVALVVGAPDAVMTMATMEEPTIGVNGYARIAIERNAVGWPNSAEVAGERMIGTDWLTWTPTGTGFNKPVQRLALIGSASGLGVGAPVYALSSAMPAPATLLATTPVEQRRFKYEIFL